MSVNRIVRFFNEWNYYIIPFQYVTEKYKKQY